MKRKNIALIGCGRWGSNILRDLLALNCQVTVVDISEERRAFALNSGAHKVVSSVEDISAADGAIVCTPTSIHAETIRQLIPLGVPMFCEKPLSNDLNETKELASQLDGRLFVMDKWRYHSGIVKMAELARSGNYGSPVGLMTVRRQLGNPHPDVDGIWILAPHDLSIALEIFGYVPRVEAARAYGSSEKLTDLIGWLGDSPWYVCIISTSSPARERMIKLFLSKAVLLLPDSLIPELLVIDPEEANSPAPKPKEVITFQEEMPLLTELKCFINHIEGGPAPKSSAKEALAIVETIIQLRSQAQKQTLAAVK